MRNQDGFASLVIAITLVLVLSLMTVGFAQLSQKETRSALDRQLSSQAFYAAETGINDAAKAVNAGFAIGKANCEPYTPSNLNTLVPLTPEDPISNGVASTYLTDNHVGPSNSNSKYTCLTIDPAPTSLEYGDVGTDQSKITVISGFSPDGITPTAIDNIIVSWQSPDTTFAFPAACTGNDCFKPSDEWVTPPPVKSLTGVLRLGLTPLYTGGINRSDLTNNTYTAFLYPGASTSPPGSPTSYDVTNNTGVRSGGILNGACNSANNSGLTPRSCNVQITGINSQSYMLNLRGIYNKSLVTVKAYNSSTQLRIKNGQTLVDSTGIAEDVLRRVQVRIPSRNTYAHPDYDLDTAGNLCKQLQLLPQGLSPSLGNNSSKCSP